MKINKLDKRTRRRALIEFALRSMKNVDSIVAWVRRLEIKFYEQPLNIYKKEG